MTQPSTFVECAGHKKEGKKADRKERIADSGLTIVTSVSLRSSLSQLSPVTLYVKRQKDKKTERQKDKKTERQKDRNTEIQNDRKTGNETELS